MATIKSAKKPSRTSTMRSKTGCVPRRQRRIECTEGRPRCHACVRLDLLCDCTFGSGQSLIAYPAAAIMRQVSVASYAIPFRMPGSQDDWRAMHYSCTFAATRLTSYLPEFWSTCMLQRCQSDSLVRQAIVTLSHAHLEKLEPKASTY
jgi:hypothetical protein